MTEHNIVKQLFKRLVWASFRSWGCFWGFPFRSVWKILQFFADFRGVAITTRIQGERRQGGESSNGFEGGRNDFSSGGVTFD